MEMESDDDGRANLFLIRRSHFAESMNLESWWRAACAIRELRTGQKPEDMYANRWRILLQTYRLSMMMEHLFEQQQQADYQ